MPVLFLHSLVCIIKLLPLPEAPLLFLQKTQRTKFFGGRHHMAIEELMADLLGTVVSLHHNPAEYLLEDNP